ncbi:hypothetical protein Tco_0597916 [Tanacetum coccineum]
MRSTGIKRYIDPISGCKIWRTNRKGRIPIDLYSCKVDESMTMRKVGDQTIRVIRRRRIDKKRNVFRFQEYHTSDEEKEKELSNMNGWLTEDANDSDLESTVSSQPMSLIMEDIGDNSSEVSMKSKRDVRTSCEVELQISKTKDEKWCVDIFNDTLNYDLTTTPMKVMKHCSQNKFYRSMAYKSLMVELWKSGLRPCQVRKVVNAMKSLSEPTIKSKQCADILAGEQKQYKDTIQLEDSVSTISQEYLLEFTSEYDIPESLHPEFPGP